MGFQGNNRGEQPDDFHDMQLALANGGALDERRLLAMLLARSMPYRAADQTARRLMKRFCCISRVLSSKLDDLLRVKGVSHKIAIDLIQVRHLLSAISFAMVAGKPVIDCYDTMIGFCASQFRAAQHEEFHALFLNKRLELVHHNCLQTGTLDHVTVYPREVLRLALEHSASHIILAHNHPFGSAKPSKADLVMTRQLATLAAGLGISILDHIIIAENSHFSFLKSGLMEGGPADLLGQLRPERPENWE